MLGACSLIAFSENDLRIGPIYGAADLEAASTAVNRAVDRLSWACATTGRFITAEVINAALNDLDEADRALNLAPLSLPLPSR